MARNAIGARQHQINVRLSDIERRRLEEIALERGCRATEVLRYMIQDATAPKKDAP